VLAARIDACSGQPDAADALVAMLAEDSLLYAGRTVNECERLRGYVLATFETVGVPAGAMPFVLEELETGRNPYTVAAAARALRGAHDLPAEAPELLVAAISRLRGSDEAVSFGKLALSAPSTASSTMLGELASTLTLLGDVGNSAAPALSALLDDAASEFSSAVREQLMIALDRMSHSPGCCHHHADTFADSAALHQPSTAVAAGEVADVVLEDQDRKRQTFREAFAGHPSALAFFYTRCMNPEKCSLTVTRLAGLARRLAAEQTDANVGAISYDPGFDRPGRLRRYGADRGMEFSPTCSLFRTLGPFDPIRDTFALGVGYGPVTVNRHRIDLIVLDPALNVAARFERRLWNDDDVVSALVAASA
jgi:protein SCO1/2